MEMDREKANIMRLRVNRLNLVQRIEPSEILPKLVKLKVIDKNEAQAISSGRTREDRSRNLIDHLISKEHFQKDWFNHFRNILQDCNYKELVVFLDNTIIKPPSFVSRFPSKETGLDIEKKTNDQNSINQDENQNLQSAISLNQVNNLNFNNIKNGSKNVFEKVTGIYFDEDSLNSIMIKGNYEKTVLNLQTYSVRPEVLIAELSKSDDLDDIKQIDVENVSFISMKKLELLYSLYQSEETMKSSFFLDTEVVSTIINSKHSFTYMKYFKNLHDSFGIDMLKIFKDFFNQLIISKTLNLKFYENLHELVKRLSWFFMNNEKNELAQQLINSYLHHITLNEGNSDILVNNIKLKNTFEAQSLLLLIKNNLMDFKNSYEVFTALSNLLNHIKKLTIGNPYNRYSILLKYNIIYYN